MFAEKGDIGADAGSTMVCKFGTYPPVGITRPVCKVQLFLRDVVELREIIRIPVGVGRGGHGAGRPSIGQKLTPVSVPLLSAERHMGALD